MEEEQIRQLKQEGEIRYPFDEEDDRYGHTRWVGKHDEYEAFVKGGKFVLNNAPESVKLVWDERLRQINQEGYDSFHDDGEAEGQLSKSAMVYACPECQREQVMNSWSWDMQDLKLSSEDTIEGRIKNLIKAGALICAEIDRLERLEHK